MTKYQINLKSSRYLRDKETFLKELKQFNDTKNIPYKVPIVNGIEIDLYHFYTLVQQKGGLSKVNQNDIWDSFLRPLQLPHPCVNGSTLLRRIYGTYLEKYDRAKGPPGRDDDNDLDEDPRRTRGGGMPRITFGGGSYISASGEQLRTGNRVAGPSERLALSLLSPMPNEQDFAVNVCTVLAADQTSRLPLPTAPHILDFLLAHAGVYNHSSLRDTIGRSYYETRGRYPHEFWQLRAGGGGAKELADETKFMHLDAPELMVQALAAHNTLTDCLNEGFDDHVLERVEELKKMQEEPLEDWVTEPSDEDQLFAPVLPGGASCVFTQRVQQIASIVRSLSFQEENLPYLAKNTTLIRFLLLCTNCWVGTLRQIGLDALGNVSTELVIKDPATCLISRHVLSTIQAALVSPDRARCLAALELLNKLAQNELNEEALLRVLEPKVYADVCALLTLRDIMLLVCTLECVYALTSLGDKACESVAKLPGLLQTLVSLVTVEAQSYGPRACILMRVVETVSGGDTERAGAQAQPPAVPPLTSSKPPSPLPPATPTPAAPAAPPTPAPPTPAPTNNVQQSHLQQKSMQENENFAQAWLRSSYMPLPAGDNSAIDASDVFRQYLAASNKLGRKAAVTPPHFHRLVRTIFGGTVGPNTVTTSTGESQQVYIGIRARSVQRPTQPAGPSSPILKAQLTNKPAEAAKPTTQQQQPQQQQTGQHQHISQALEGNASNTSLIKHLLAHKVSPALPAQQVAQRQNQQRATGANPGTVVVQPGPGMDLDPEALIKCTTILPGGIASSSVIETDKVILSTSDEGVIVQKEEPVQIQIDDQSQLTIKTAQNKMLADLLEKKSNPPVQVVQMTPQINAPTIQITETGQIVQVKTDNPVIQINESGLLSQSSPYFQIKNDQGQIIQIKNEQGQIIHLKGEQVQPMIHQMLVKDGQLIQGQVMQGQMIQGIGQPTLVQGHVKLEKEADVVVADHSYTEPPAKKQKVEEKRDVVSPQESVSKTAANLYAALAASALEDEEDLRPRGIIVSGPRRVQKMPPKQEHMEIAPTVMITDNSTPVIIQEPILQVQQPTLQVQQPTMQIQPTSIQVQQPTMQVQQPMLQVQPMDVQNIIASQAGQIILQEKPIVSQSTQFVQQPMQLIAAPGSAQGGLSYITQSIPGNMMQKTIIIVQGPTGGGPLTLTVNNPGGLDEATLNSVIAQATEAISQQQMMQNQGVIQSTQRVMGQSALMGQSTLMGQPTLMGQSTLMGSSQAITVVKAAIGQNTSQLTASQQPIITTQPQPSKATIVNQPQQIVVTQKQPPSLMSTSTGSHIIQGNQQLMQGNQQIIAVSNNQQIIMNAPMKSNVHRVVQQPRNATGQVTVAQTDNKPSVIQSNTKPQQSAMRQVITRQPVMIGNTKIGDKETVVNTPNIPEKPPTPKPTATPPPQETIQPDSPWICHWKGCGKVFACAGSVFTHAARAHAPGGAAGEAPCMWVDCDRVPRKTFALLNHLTDKHCSPQALRATYNAMGRQTTEGENKPVSLGYPPNAALAALNKHAQEMFNPRELMHRADLNRTMEPVDENEGPVTKSIRLTAALILRNIVIYSNTGRRQLRSFESHLASIALSSVEASRTIAQVLYDMNNI